jgi:hypothetical protein
VTNEKANESKRSSQYCDAPPSDAAEVRRDDVTADDRQPLVGAQSPHHVSVSRLESGPNSVYLAMTSSPCPRSPYTEEEDDEEDEEEENLSLTSPGTPCSQCLRDEEEASREATEVGHGASTKKVFYNGERSHHFADADQQSSEDCCSVESGSLCCNSSCCEEHHAAGFARKSAEGNRGKRISLSEEAAAKLGQRSQSRESALAAVAAANGDGSLRQLVTYVTPGLETVPLEMCQDIPDVLI